MTKIKLPTKPVKCNCICHKEQTPQDWEIFLEYALPDRLTEEEKQVIRNNVSVLLSRQLPMGISQWKNHGKRNGYWEYFEKEIHKEILAKIEQVLLNHIKFIGENEQIYTGCPNDILEEIINDILEEIIKVI